MKKTKTTTTMNEHNEKIPKRYNEKKKATTPMLQKAISKVSS